MDTALATALRVGVGTENILPDYKGVGVNIAKGLNDSINSINSMSSSMSEKLQNALNGVGGYIAHS